MTYQSLYFPKLTRRPRYERRAHYKHYRQDIRVDCQGRCVYCDAHENELGGQENMTIDHFRPINHFSHLEHNPFNLVWSCSRCNGYKQNYWPALGTLHTIVHGRGFIDPFIENQSEYFEVLPDGSLKAIKDPARYLINTLKLNRTGAKRIRENRNKKYERKQETEAYLIRVKKEIDILLGSIQSDEARKALLEHKKTLEDEVCAIIKALTLDFNLY
jgi:hypothetical protein